MANFEWFNLQKQMSAKYFDKKYLQKWKDQVFQKC